MSDLWPLVALVTAALLALRRKERAIRAPDAAIRANYVGRPVPVVLGQVLVASANPGLLLALGLAVLAGPVPDWPVALLLWGGAYLLLAIGALDDRSSDEARGIRAHLESLMHGRLTTGIWKLGAGVFVSVFISMQLGGGLFQVALSTLVIALAINVMNALDVRPGRALRWSLPVIGVLVFVLRAQHSGLPVAGFAYLGAAAMVFGDDVRERAMLGDAGSNPLGLVLGTCVAAALPGWGLLVALVILVGLQVAAETVTISRMIDAVPPLRWFDRLGRRN